VTQADCNARHLRIFACRHALVATMRVEAGRGGKRNRPSTACPRKAPDVWSSPGARGQLCNTAMAVRFHLGHVRFQELVSHWPGISYPPFGGEPC
jgi:hypothetical protein